MTLDKEHLESLSTKDGVIDYAEELGITGLVKQRGLSKLKGDVIAKYNSKDSTSVDKLPDAIPEISDKELLEMLVEETDKQDVATKTVIDGAPSVQIKLDGKDYENISLASLEKWCEERHIPFSTAKHILDKSWLNHNGFSFKLNK